MSLRIADTTNAPCAVLQRTSSPRVNLNSTMARQLGYALVYGCIVLVGLPLNAVSLWILLRRHSLKSPGAVFMINLALSDLMLISSLPMRIYAHATGTWALGKQACNIATMLFRANLRSSSVFITVISVDRLLAVVYPLRSRHLRTSSNAWKAAAVIWISLVAVNIPESVMFSKHFNNKTNCFEPPSRRSGTSVASVSQSMFTFILLAVNIFCTALVSWTLHRHLPGHARVNNKVNVMLIFVTNLIMFIVCFLPFSIGLLNFEHFSNLPPLICLASINCCLDPLLYYFSLDAFWKKKDDINHTTEL